MSNQPPRLGDYMTSRRQKGEAGLPTLSVTLNNGLVRRDSLERKTDTNLDPKQHLRVLPGDIAYNMMRMWQGASGLADEEALVSPAYVVLAPRSNLDPRYAAYLFKTDRMIHNFWAYSYGLTNDRLRLYPNDALKVPVAIPPLPEQRKIADILSTWDAAIEKTEALLDTARTQKRALMQSLLTGKRRFPEFKGQLWKEVRLVDVVKIDWGNTSITKKSYVESGVPAYSAAGRDGFVENAEMSGPGIVLSAIGARCGRCFWADEEWTAIKNTIVLREKRGCCDLRFIFQIVNDARYWPISGGAQPFIGLRNARNAKLNLPSIEEQGRIADALDTADREIAMSYDGITKLRTEKKALMQQLLTGKRRVVV